jgi:tetratricopeptide (TPR) repeat protein
VLIALIIRRVFFPPPKPRGPSILKSVAVMSFENITGESSPENWTAATQYLLHIDLEMSRFLRVITRERLRDCLNELHINDTGVYAQADLDRIASRENIDIFVLGACLTSGTGCRIDIRLLDARLREPLNSHSFNAAAFVEIQDRCDDISLWVKDELALIKGGQAKDYDRELKSYTSKSSEALEHFFRGLELYEKRDIKKSTEAYLMALAADSDFALAHARLAMNFTYEGKSAEAKSHLLKAMSLRNKLTARERLLIEGDYYNLYENDYAGAIRKYESLLRDYPNDEMALEHQGAIYRIIEEWEKAQRCFERVRAINPRSRIVVRNLSFIAEARGEYEKAERLLRDNKDVYSSSEEFQRDLARCLLCRGRPDQAWRELEKARCSDAPSLACLLLHGHIQLTMGNYKDAETTYRRVAEKGWTDIDRLEEHYWLGQLYLLRGQFENCARELEEGLKTASEGGLLYEEWNFLWLRSYLYLLQGDFVEAYGTAVKARQ